MNAMDRFKDTFFQECDELLGALEVCLANLDKADEAEEALNAAFRCVHTIKGGAGMFALHRIANLSHMLESAFDQIRQGSMVADRKFIEKALQDDQDKKIIEEIHSLLAMKNLEPVKTISSVVEKKNPDQPVATEKSSRSIYRIMFEPGEAAARSGTEPLVIARNLAALGKLITVTDLSRLPAFSEIDPVSTYFSYTFTLETEHAVEKVQEVFEFASATSHFDIDVMDAAEIKHQPIAAVARINAEAKPMANSAQVDRRVSSIRVDLDRVERLVDLVGEIAIAQSALTQELEQAQLANNSEIIKALSQVVMLSRNLQEGVMAIRAQPVRSIFSRMPRIVREAEQLTGKRVRLVTSGELTEIDKTIIEHLGDPLMHLLRNAIDHGIETLSERRAAGKPDIGTIHLSASQRGGRIIVEVSDDGRGINRAKVFAKAQSLGLVSTEDQYQPNEIDSLVFHPGLSTAEQISSLSGRGVGMDVVAKNIKSIGGRVSIRSEPGVGCTTSITLPLTLAVLDAMLVQSQAQAYFIPMSSLIECIVVKADEINRVPGMGNYITVRGQPVPVVSLAEHVGNSSGAARHERNQIVLLERDEGGKFGMIVDDICGYRQVVVKAIDNSLTGLKGVSGATILGDGSVGLILDVTQFSSIAPGNGSGLVSRTKAQHSQKVAAA
jgi:two-component system, chemotaxis family, sensor kinase CheA